MRSHVRTRYITHIRANTKPNVDESAYQLSIACAFTHRTHEGDDDASYLATWKRRKECVHAQRHVFSGVSGRSSGMEMSGGSGGQRTVSA